MAKRRGDFWRKTADVIIPGNAYNSQTGRWNPTTTKIGIVSLIGGLLFPGSGVAIRAIGNKMFGDNTPKFRTDLSGIPNGRTPDNIGAVQPSVFKPDTHVSVSNVGVYGINHNAPAYNSAPPPSNIATSDSWAGLGTPT
jgi:hypothetical protein